MKPKCKKKINPTFALCLLALLPGCTSPAAPRRPIAPFLTRLEGYSNWPITKPGQLLLIESIRGDQVRPGIWLCVTWGSGLNVLHPVDHISGKRIYLRGAWNSRCDAPITFDQVNGYWRNPADPRTWLN